MRHSRAVVRGLDHPPGAVGKDAVHAALPTRRRAAGHPHKPDTDLLTQQHTPRRPTPCKPERSQPAPPSRTRTCPGSTAPAKQTRRSPHTGDTSARSRELPQTRPTTSKPTRTQWTKTRSTRSYPQRHRATRHHTSPTQTSSHSNHTPQDAQPSQARTEPAHTNTYPDRPRFTAPPKQACRNPRTCETNLQSPIGSIAAGRGGRRCGPRCPTPLGTYRRPSAGDQDHPNQGPFRADVVRPAHLRHSLAINRRQRHERRRSCQRPSGAGAATQAQ
ncbi:hypothetical protein H4W33_002011 [Kibdelosporangium phytohabitans]|nr:hypothetical protein [Kibdelosporangium phytohabitans]